MKRRFTRTMIVFLILASLTDASKDTNSNSVSTIGTMMESTVKPASMTSDTTELPTTKSTNAYKTPKPVSKSEGIPSAGCCAKCIGDTSQAVYTYDPLVFEQCQAAKGICCFGCKPEDAFHPILDNCTYPDGITPQVPSDDWIKFQWQQVTRVTYEFYQVGQRKMTTVRNSSAEARIEGDWFFICPHAPGKVVLRGWGADSCHLASKEFTINIAQGSSSSTKCSDHLQVEVNVANTKHDGTEECNLQRATISKVNGVDTCICTSEWRGPPSCSGFSWWKIVITGSGGAAAVLSVVVSVRAFLNSRKRRVNDDHPDDGTVMGDYPFRTRDNVFRKKIQSPQSSEEYEL